VRDNNIGFPCILQGEALFFFTNSNDTERGTTGYKHTDDINTLLLTQITLTDNEKNQLRCNVPDHDSGWD
ncbi:MAG: hypothetical protein IJ253_07170, partial [Bacteroidaceae bacterium]|nr:hypothetical protein [Bacteroidaceae bacterium]